MICTWLAFLVICALMLSRYLGQTENDIVTPKTSPNVSIIVQTRYVLLLKFYAVLNLRVQYKYFDSVWKNLVKVSVWENFCVVVNYFNQFHSTFIRNHSRFFVRVGHKTTYAIGGNTIDNMTWFDQPNFEHSSLQKLATF